MPLRLAALIAAILLPLALTAAPSDQEFEVRVGDQSLKVRILSPTPEKLAAHPLLLLTFSTDRHTSLTQELYAAPAKMFLEAGHRALSFDLPSHGERQDAYGPGIEGMREQFLHGRDPFKQFVADGKAVIDECIRRGWAEPGRIVVCGVSRAGYCALRLAAADRRITAALGLAPVTDWRALSNFAKVRERSDVATLDLDNFAADLAGRSVYLAIGNADRRVGTDAFLRFALALATEEARLGLTASKLKVVVADDTKGHSIDNKWRDEGTRFLLHCADPAYHE